jgi:hypothetical protein
MPAPIRIKIGASVDQSVQTSFTSIVDAAKKARAAVAAEMKAAGVEARKGLSEGIGGHPFRALPAEAKETAKQVKDSAAEAAHSMGSLATGAAAKFKSLADGLKGLPADLKVVSREATKALQAMEREKARAALGLPTQNQNRLYWSALGGNLQIKKPVLQTVTFDPLRSAGNAAMGAAGYGIGAARYAARAAIGLARDIGVETDVGAMARRNIDDESLAQRISSAGYMPGQSGPNGQIVDRGTILGETRRIAIGTGQERGDVLAGLDAFVSKTGDLQTGREVLSDMARLSKATGSHMEDMVNAAAEVSNNLGDIPNKGKAINSIMMAVAGQGKLGAVEIRDMASQMAKLGSVSHMFQGGAAAVIPLMGVLAQESKLQGGSASATQAATSVMGLARGLVKGKTYEHWQAMGLTPFADKGHTILKDPRELIREALEKTHGDQLLMGQLLPEASGQRAIRGFANIYNDAGGGNKGLAAVNAEFERLASAQLTATEVTRALGEAMDTDKSKITTFNEQMAQIVEETGKSLLPALEALAPTVIEVAQSIGAAATYITGRLPGGSPEDVSNTDHKLKSDAEKDAKALKDSAKPGYDADGNPITSYGQAEFDKVRGTGAKRSAFIGELTTRVNTEKEATDTGFWGKHSKFASELLFLQGMPLIGDAIREHRETAETKLQTDEKTLAGQLDEAKTTNALLREISEKMENGTGALTPPPIPPGGTAPPDAVTE